jgi:hypothetical protein
MCKEKGKQDIVYNVYIKKGVNMVNGYKQGIRISRNVQECTSVRASYSYTDETNYMFIQDFGYKARKY